MNPTEKPPLTVHQVASALGVSARTVRRLIEAGAIESTKYGRAVRVLPEVLEKFRREGTCDTTPTLEESAPRRQSLFDKAAAAFGLKSTEGKGGDASSSKTRRSRRSS